MAYSTLSAKFQIVVPKQIRDTLGLEAKEKLIMWCEDEVIEMLPVKKNKNPLAVLASLSKKKLQIPIEKLEEETEDGLIK